MENGPCDPDPFGSVTSFARASNSSIVIADARDPGHPVVFVNPSFEKMTGYTSQEIIGKNCRFLQQDDRAQEDRVRIRDALRTLTPCECLLRNYRKSGEMFWNKLYLFPISIAPGEVTHFVGVQHDVTLERTLLADVQHTAKERARLIEELDRKQRHLISLSLDLVNAQETERKALARELHDELGQRLSALNLMLHQAHPYMAGGNGQVLWERAEREMTSLIGLVRDMSVSLRPPALDFFGLEATIQQLLARQFEGGPAWTFDYAGLPSRLAPAVEISVYRLVQESVTNIVRHASARHVVVEINGGADQQELELIIRDDGTGFDAAAWREHAARSDRAGVAGMSERIALLGGRFEVDSAPGQGTRITALIPLIPLRER